jgi:hypothetical protein
MQLCDRTLASGISKDELPGHVRGKLWVRLGSLVYCQQSSLSFHDLDSHFKPATITEKSGSATQKLERLLTFQLLALGCSVGFYANEKSIRWEFQAGSLRNQGMHASSALVGPK